MKEEGVQKHHVSETFEMEKIIGLIVLQDPIESAGRESCVSGGTRKIWCTMSFQNLVKPFIQIAPDNKW